jgi:basic amino acid/polyamine antiporter, APA family
VGWRVTTLQVAAGHSLKAEPEFQPEWVSGTLPAMDARAPQLVRGLSLIDSTALVIGTVIGSGVFLKSATMAQDVGSPGLVLLAWVAAGLLSLAGALTYAELAAMQPEAGGEYVFLRSSYGEPAAFLFGWQRFVVAGSASIASLAAGLAIFLSAFVPLQQVWLEREFTFLSQPVRWQFGAKQVVAVGIVAGMTLLNCLSVAFGGKVQSLLTGLKLLGIAFIVCGVFLASGTASWEHLRRPEDAPAWSGLSLFGSAMLAALWGYDGWNNMPMAAGEVRSPERNIPRALIMGMLGVIGIYCVLNLAYFYALPFSEVVTSNSTRYRDAVPVATKAAESFCGSLGGRFISLVFVISAFGALNGSILSNARVPFAMARDGLFFRSFGKLHPRTRVPIFCLLVQGCWACVLALSGTFDQLTDCLLFVSWIFYALVTSSVFILRYRHPDWHRPHRAWGYPVVPIVFLAVALWLIVNTLLTKRVESVAGLVLVGAGVPLFFFFRRRRTESRR